MAAKKGCVETVKSLVNEHNVNITDDKGVSICETTPMKID